MNSGHRLFTAHRRPSCTVPAITGLDIMVVAGDDDGNDIGVGRLGYIAARPRDVRCYPKSGQTRLLVDCPLSAKSRLMHRSKQPLYSITLLALVSNVGDTVRPSALAVLRLITSSNFVVSWTGRSPGFSPLRMRSTYVMPCRCSSSRLKA